MEWEGWIILCLLGVQLEDVANSVLLNLCSRCNT